MRKIWDIYAFFSFYMTNYNENCPYAYEALRLWSVKPEEHMPVERWANWRTSFLLVSQNWEVYQALNMHIRQRKFLANSKYYQRKTSNIIFSISNLCMGLTTPLWNCFLVCYQFLSRFKYYFSFYKIFPSGTKLCVLAEFRLLICVESLDQLKFIFYIMLIKVFCVLIWKLSVFSVDFMETGKEGLLERYDYPFTTIKSGDAYFEVHIYTYIYTSFSHTFSLTHYRRPQSGHPIHYYII